MIFGTRSIVLGFFFSLAMACCSHAQEQGGVFNGSFERTTAGGRAPEGWQAAGDKAVVQELTAERDPARGHVARLSCTRFVPGTSSSHAMISQFGHVGVRNGQWYRLSLWARASDLEAGVVQLGLANFRSWTPAGLSGNFVPSDKWQRFQFVFRAQQDLKPADSRLAIYFLSTGTLWLDDVAIEETTEPRRQWLPAVSLTGATNALVNSSFEGGEGWGCSAGRNYDWTANLFRRVGQWDESQAFHGKRSWKVTLSAEKPLLLYGGYTLLQTEVRELELGHAGWVRVEPGEPCVFSVYVKSDQAGVPVRVSLKEPEIGRLSSSRTSSIGPTWQRIEVSYTPQGPFVRGCLAFNLPEGDKGQRTLWIDAAQLQRGTVATPYHPRVELEAGIETGVTGNIFTDPGKGLAFRLRAFNDAQQTKTLAGRLRVTDFQDQTVWEEKPGLVVGPGQSAQRSYAVLAGRRGFFRIHWEPEGGPAQTLRCAVIEPSEGDDAIFGFNHAFGQDFVLPLAQQAGLRWWRRLVNPVGRGAAESGCALRFPPAGRPHQPRAGAEGPHGGAAAFSQRELGGGAAAGGRTASQRRCRQEPRAPAGRAPIPDAQGPPDRARLALCRRQRPVPGAPGRQAGAAGGFRRVRAGDRDARQGPGQPLRDPQRVALHLLLPAQRVVRLQVQDVRLSGPPAHGLPGGQGSRPEMHGDRRRRLRAR